MKGQSFEGMVIDNDMLGNVQRLDRGIEVTDDTLSYDVIRHAVFGTRHFLKQPQTLELMQFMWGGFVNFRIQGKKGRH